MKKYFLLITFAFLGLSLTYAQTPEQISTIPLDSALDSEVRVNMAIPTTPAFQVLGGNPSNLMRVSNPREFSLAVSDFFSNGSVVVPRNFGVEFSPYMVLENGGLFKDTMKAQWARPLRVSLGTKMSDPDTVNPTDFTENVGIGLRYTYTKEGSSFQGYKKKLRRQLQPLTDNYEERVDSLRKVFVENHNMNLTTFMATAPDSAVNAFLEARDAWCDSVYGTLPCRISENGFDATVEQVKKQFKREAWNDFQLDFASAIKLTSPDTILTVSLDTLEKADTTITLNSASFWGTVSFPLFGTNWLQVMIGGNYTMTRDTGTVFKSIYSASSRVYLGSNRLKGFIEGQYSSNQVTDVQNFLGSVGAEINFIDGIWASFYVGLSQELGAARSRAVTQFNLHFALPEKFNLN